MSTVRGRSVYPPIRGKAFDLYFQITKNDGTTVLAPTDLAARVVLDGRGFDLRRAPELVDAATGTCKAVIPAHLTKGAALLFTAVCTDEGAMSYTERIHTAAQTLDQQAAQSRSRKIGGW